MSSSALAQAFDRDKLAAGLRWLAERGVFLGTSSWNYPGWLGKLYTQGRYETRGKFSKGKFERDCLREHAEVFSSVCVDASYYSFPSPKKIQDLMEATPGHYRFTFKVTDDITVRTFPNHASRGQRAGLRNEHFLDAELFQRSFLEVLSPWQHKCGALVFEFSHFHPRDFARGRDFMDALSGFLSALPKGWRYAVEVRNRNLLQPEYFAMLREHGVAHVFNAWTRMPEVHEQMAMDGSLDCANFRVARFLLKAGRTFEEAIGLFQPYSSAKEPNLPARESATNLILELLDQGSLEEKRHLFLYINNRLEGCSLETIFAVLLMVERFKHGIFDRLPPPRVPETLL